MAQSDFAQVSLRDRINERWDLALVAALLVYFAVRLVFFAVSIDATVPPDEVDHFARSETFSRAWWIPEDSPATYAAGPIAGRPFLFYWLMGKALLLNILPLSDLVFARLINAGLGMATVLFGYRWVRLLTGNQIIHVLFVALATNTLMFTGVSASVSYDNLTNLLAAAAVFYLFAFFDHRRPLLLAAFFCCVFAGTLTKQAFWPLAVMLCLVLVIRERRALLDVRFRHAAALLPRRVAPAVAWGLVSMLFATNLALFGGNIVRYRQLIPSPVDLYGLDAAMENRIFARDYLVAQFKKGEMSFDEATRAALEIKNRGNRRRAINLLRRARDPEALRASLMTPGVYVAVWSRIMISRITGYDGHRVMNKHTAQLVPLFAMLVVAGVVLIRKCRLGSHLFWAAAITVSYLAVLLLYVNYPTYLASGIVDYGVRGRWVFPLLVPAYGVMAFTLVRFLPRRAQVLMALAVALYFIWGDFPFFLGNANPCWFAGTAEWPECVLSL